MTATRIPLQKMCAACGKLFTAQKATTAYCSQKCASQAYKKRKREELAGAVSLRSEVAVAQACVAGLEGKEFLSVAEVARLFGLRPQTVYNLLYSGKLKAVQFSSRLTLIRRSDIDTLFENPEAYRARYTQSPAEITEFYSIDEIVAKFDVGKSWIFRIVKQKRIPKTLLRGKAYYSKSHVDKYFAKKPAPVVEWISVEEAMRTFDLTRDALYHYVKCYAVPKEKTGRCIRISKPDLQKILKPTIP